MDAGPPPRPAPLEIWASRRRMAIHVAVAAFLGIYFGVVAATHSGAWRYLGTLIALGALYALTFDLSLLIRPQLIVSSDGIEVTQRIVGRPTTIEWSAIRRFRSKNGWLVVTPADRADPRWRGTMAPKSRVDGDVPLRVTRLMLPMKPTEVVAAAAPYQPEGWSAPGPAGTESDG